MENYLKLKVTPNSLLSHSTLDLGNGVTLKSLGYGRGELFLNGKRFAKVTLESHAAFPPGKSRIYNDGSLVVETFSDRVEIFVRAYDSVFCYSIDKNAFLMGFRFELAKRKFFIAGNYIEID